MRNIMWVFAGISGAMAVAMGAAAAHWLQGSLDVAGITRIEKAATYQMYHSLALMGVVLLRERRPQRMLDTAGWLLMLGIICFSGSLYLYSFIPIGGLMFVTPIGGVAWIVGWLLMAMAGMRRLR